MRNQSLKLIILLSTFLFLVMPAYTESYDWEKWRGEDNSGVSKEKNWKSSGINKILWEKDIGLGYASISVKGNYCYTIGWKDEKDSIYCLDSSDGSIKWSHSYASSKGGGFSGPRSTPIIDGDNLYAFSNGGLLRCLNLKTGKVKWMTNVTEHGAENVQWLFSSPALIQGELIIVNAGKSGMAFNKLSGKKVWGKSGKGAYATAVPFMFNKNAALAIFGLKNIYAVDTKSGNELWSFPWETSYDVNAADPIIIGNSMYISSGYKRGCALLDFSSGKPKKVWENQNMSNHFSSSIILPKYKNVLVGCNGNTGKGNLAAIDLKTGKQLWSTKTGFVSIFLAGDRLICINEKGVLTVGSVDIKGFKVTDTAKLAKSGKYWSMPILSNAKLYCRGSRGKLTCLDMK